MKQYFILAVFLMALTGCTVTANSKTEIAPYTIIESAESNIEVRTYEQMILASTPMDTTENRDGAFMRLFRYISGQNTEQSEIAMTAPVFMDEKSKGQKIPMTAPVFMDRETSETKPMMSFVMPSDFTLQNTPEPKDETVTVTEVKNWKVAAIRFNGRMSENNIQKHKKILEKWVLDNGYKATGPYQTAGYNAPYTLPMLRRNEVLIPVEKKETN
ncbi:MAG: heme-binding protein [Pseudomonadota bacterium]